MPKGGKRIGAGRKTIALEMGTADLAREAIIKKYGSLTAGLQSLLNTKESVLVKFVFEHAFGKPTDAVDVTTKGERLQQAIIKVYNTQVPMAAGEDELKNITGEEN